MDDLTLFEKWLTAVLATGAVVWAWANSVSSMKNRLAETEKDVKGLKAAHDRQLDDIQRDLTALRIEFKSEIKSIWDRSEERHDRILEKLDRIIEARHS